MTVGPIIRASTAADGTEGNLSSTTWYRFGVTPTLSDDGRTVVFWSVADNLVPGDTNGSGDVFVKDLDTGEIVRANTATDGTQA